MLFIFLIMLAIILVIMAVSDFFIYDDYATGIFSLVLSIAVIVMLICDAPMFDCPGCGDLVDNLFGFTGYCESCGCELIPHCIECGEVCKTAFCQLCGAEQ